MYISFSFKTFARNPNKHKTYIYIYISIQKKEKKRRNMGNSLEVQGIEGSAVLMTENLFNSGKFWASFADRFSELSGNHVTVQLVSSTCIDPDTGKCKVGELVDLKKWFRRSEFKTGKCSLPFVIKWDVGTQGIPGAIIVRNTHNFEFFLETITINGVPGKGQIHFICNSWVYPDCKRTFFANDTYIPSQTPPALLQYRKDELLSLRRNVNRPLKEDRIYDYALYNDLGDPDKGDYYARPVLGGSFEKPYPRRGLTGRPPTKRDPNSESRESLMNDIYVPHDERFGYHKRSEFEAYKIKAITHSTFQNICDLISPTEFHSFKDILRLYKSGPESREIEGMTSEMRIKFFMELGRKEGSHTFCFPEPQLIKENKLLWKNDEEFARQMLAGTNPVVIRRLEVFPPVSKLDPREFGNQTSKITANHIEASLDNGLTVNQALKRSRLFILDHHDRFMPYLRDINAISGIHVYATRTILFLQDDGTLKPVAIELSVPHPDGWIHGVESQVHTPFDHSTWQLAKAYVTVNDSAHHELISHWLNTHAVMEPFIIAANRQLSAMHPIHKLLKPHFKDTMKINAVARQYLINANGIIESAFALRHYALEWSSDAYKSWNLIEQGLPQDLIKRGVAVEDRFSLNNLRLLIEDYPYAVDGLDVWSAVESWVREYCSIYYLDDQTVKSDDELQAWWKEIRYVGHGDLKYQTWWPTMATCKELVSICTTMIWVASALHAAVNFGQYHYAGFHPNRPTVSRRPMPRPGTIFYQELLQKPEKVYLETITCPKEAMKVIATIEVLSRHPSDEEYLGQRDENWTCDRRALDAFERFRKRLIEIEKKIQLRNKDHRLKNRTGPAEVPYKLLYPNTSDTTRRGTGIVGMGIPNSVSI